jgi:hypothetical protein
MPITTVYTIQAAIEHLLQTPELYRAWLREHLAARFPRYNTPTGGPLYAFVLDGLIALDILDISFAGMVLDLGEVRIRHARESGPLGQPSPYTRVPLPKWAHDYQGALQERYPYGTSADFTITGQDALAFLDQSIW